MVSEEYIFKQAKRIYDNCVASQEQDSMAVDADGLAESYNEFLNRAQTEFPNNDIIQSLDEIQASGDLHRKAGAVQRVKSNTAKIADSLGINLSDLEDEQDDELRPINVTVDQAVDQSPDIEQSPDISQSQDQDIDQKQQQAQQQQYVDIETILEDIDRETLPPDEKAELQEIVKEFEQELEGDRDSSRLRELLGRAKQYSSFIAAKLGILGLQYGITNLLPE